MKFADIDKRFTNILAEYISKGYTINTPSMGGSQGEVSNVDVERNGEITRLFLKRFAEPFGADKSHLAEPLEGIDIIVGKANSECGVKPHDIEGWGTIWNNRLDIEYTERFYQINRQGSCFYGTKEEAEKAAEIRLKRWLYGQDHRPTRTLIDTPEARQIGARVLRRRYGLKVVKTDAVEVWRKSDGYAVTYRGKFIDLH